TTAALNQPHPDTPRSQQTHAQQNGRQPEPQRLRRTVAQAESAPSVGRPATNGKSSVAPTLDLTAAATISVPASPGLIPFPLDTTVQHSRELPTVIAEPGLAPAIAAPPHPVEGHHPATPTASQVNQR